jgi:hypothetical protein
MAGLPAAADLKTTTTWIHDFVERNGFYQTSGPNGEFLSERDHIVFDGCSVTIHVESVGTDEPPYKKESYDVDVVFNLRDIDPKVVARPTDLNGNTLPNDREWVLLRIADASRSIALRRGTTVVSTISVFPLQGGANNADSQKLADAFGHAITICGRN